MDSSLAESMNAHVLTIKTSASSGRDVISIPRCRTLPNMISASTRFFAQPRLIMPTFGLVAKSLLIFIFYGKRTSNVQHRTPNTQLSAFGVEYWALSVGRFLIAALIHRHVLIAHFQRLAVFRDLNGVRIENTNRDMLTAKLNGAVSRRNPPFESGLPFRVAHSHPNVGSFERANSDAILFG